MGVYMFRKISYLITLGLFIIILLSCEKSNPVTPDETISFVSFFDKGGTVPSPITTLVTINIDSIKLMSMQNGNVVNYWSNKLLVDDYSHLSSIINENKLMEASDPVLPSGISGCAGSYGMTIIIKNQNIIDTLNIFGSVVCAKSYWPAGLSSLVAFKDSLVNKYKP
jgi:hypothetical protein